MVLDPIALTLPRTLARLISPSSPGVSRWLAESAMAGDWIPIRCDLMDDPAVINMAAELELSENHITGLLVNVWSWASCQTIDGNAPSVTFAFLNRRVGVTGFAEAMEKQGWLERNGAGLTIPKFDRYMSESAKKRAQTRIRVRKHRNAPSVTKALPQNRTEQNRTESPKEDSLPPTPQKRKAKGRSEASTQAEILYRTYPRHVGKAAALKAIAKVLKDGSAFAELLPKVDAYANSPDVQAKLGTADEQFIPHPATWFNQGRWMDEKVQSRGSKLLED